MNGDSGARFRGKKPNGDYYKKELSVSKLIDYYKPTTFSVSKGKLMVDGTREILTDDQVRTKAIGYYRHKENGLGRAPSIYNYMKTKFANVSYKKIEKAVQSVPAYQKFQARHVKKPKSRAVIVSRSPGQNIDTDVMYFSSEYYTASHNEGYDALVVLVDRFSGYIAISPLKRGKKQKTADVVAHKTARLLNSPGFPKKANGVIFHDNGVEYREIFPEIMRQNNYRDVVISSAAGAPSSHAERAVGIIRGLINTKLTSAGGKPSKRWWPLARTIVSEYNRTPMTDARAPFSPNQLKEMSPRKQAAITAAMRKAGAKRVGRMGSRKDAEGNRVSKSLKILSVGDRVRYALENIRKTGANKRPYPKQRWSDTTHTVQKIHPRKTGFARYTISNKEGRRFEREDLQKIA